MSPEDLTSFPSNSSMTDSSTYSNDNNSEINSSFLVLQQNIRSMRQNFDTLLCNL